MTPTAAEIDLQVTLNRSPAFYAPGDELQAIVDITPEDSRTLKAIELSTVWYTVGKGDEDLHVHAFVRETISPAVEPYAPVKCRHQLATRLPLSPLSYPGAIVKVCWSVRVRLFHAGGKQTLIETPIQLGNVLAWEGEKAAKTSGKTGAWQA